MANCAVFAVVKWEILAGFFPSTSAAFNNFSFRMVKGRVGVVTVDKCLSNSFLPVHLIFSFALTYTECCCKSCGNPVPPKVDSAEDLPVALSKCLD